jgi:hypothetical protein
MPAIPTRNMRLKNFCAFAADLHEADHGDFVKFVLQGTHDGTQTVLDPILDTMSDMEDFSARRDYDSLLGIDKDILVSSALTAYPVAKKEDTLTRNIHVSSHFTNSGVC